MREELVDGINGVRLHGIVGGIDEELRDVALSTTKIRSYPNEKRFGKGAAYHTPQKQRGWGREGGQSERASNYRAEPTRWACAGAVAFRELARRRIARITRCCRATGGTVDATVLGEREGR